MAKEKMFQQRGKDSEGHGKKEHGLGSERESWPRREK
jgi:hypothetical protein